MDRVIIALESWPIKSLCYNFPAACAALSYSGRTDCLRRIGSSTGANIGACTGVRIGASTLASEYHITLEVSLPTIAIIIRGKEIIFCGQY